MSNLKGAFDSLLLGELDEKEFSTGSKGFFAGGKIAQDGVRYQAQVSAILVGSKADPSATVAGTTDQALAVLSQFLEHNMAPKTFSSGKTGVYGTGKVVINGQRFQVNAQAVRIGA